MDCDGMEPFPERITFSLRNVIRSQYRLSLSHYCDDNEDAFFSEIKAATPMGTLD